MTAGTAGEEGAERLLGRFLASYSERTRQAYTSDLDDFARFRGRSQAAVIAELLAGREQGQRLTLDFAVELRRRGLAPATVRRRLSTLSSLVGLAGELSVVSWSLEVPSDEQVAAAAARSRPDNGQRDVAYFLPRHEAEIDRLDVQHYALLERLGANYLAPLEQPARILDVGCGTGLWAYELSAEFPDACVVGFDLAVSKRPWPAGYRFVRGNLLQGLPFADDRFDFVHQRFLMAGVPVKDWNRTMTELVRVTRPNGWLELVEMEFDIAPAGPATRRMFEMAWRVGRSAGLDTTGIIYRSLGEHARRAGLIDVETREGTVSIGEWGGRIGSLMATDFRALFIRTAGLFEKFGVSEQEFLELVTVMQQEWEEQHSQSRFTVAVGRKPG